MHIKHSSKVGLVSIILPTFNAQSFIAETIKSVLSQSYQDFELLVVDDASTDTTVKIVNEFSAIDRRIKLFTLPENSGGPAKPRNRALQEASGAYLAFIDADDLWHKNKLSLQLESMQEMGLNFSSTKLLRFKDVSELRGLAQRCGNAHEPVSLHRLLRKNIIANSSVLLDRSVAGRLRFSEDAKHQAVEDYLAWIQLHDNPEVRSARLDQRTVFYRIRDDSISSSKFAMAKKIFAMLGEVRVGGNDLGLRRLYYFCTYLWGSFRGKMYS